MGTDTANRSGSRPFKGRFGRCQWQAERDQAAGRNHRRGLDGGRKVHLLSQHDRRAGRSVAAESENRSAGKRAAFAEGRAGAGPGRSLTR